jgi:hypothetical protein
VCIGRLFFRVFVRARRLGRGPTYHRRRDPRQAPPQTGRQAGCNRRSCGGGGAGRTWGRRGGANVFVGNRERSRNAECGGDPSAGGGLLSSAPAPALSHTHD